jgi:hypothetical protein
MSSGTLLTTVELAELCPNHDGVLRIESKPESDIAA